jgi:hypothetical protein
LPETEKAVLRFLAAYKRRSGDRKKPTQILDLGASDGITSVNLLEAIRRNSCHDVEITVTDLCAVLCRYRKGPVTEYRSTGGYPVMLRLGRLGLRLPHSEYRWDGLGTTLAKLYLGYDRFRAAMIEDLRISLINPSVICDPAVRIAELDCLKFEPSLVNRFDLIRASNLITPRYGFDGESLRQALVNLHGYLCNGGCLIISRNARYTEAESGSAWTKEKGGFVPIQDFGGGSEIKAEVSAFAIETEHRDAGKPSSSVDGSARSVRDSHVGNLGVYTGG